MSVNITISVNSADEMWKVLDSEVLFQTFPIYPDGLTYPCGLLVEDYAIIDFDVGQRNYSVDEWLESVSE